MTGPSRAATRSTNSTDSTDSTDSRTPDATVHSAASEPAADAAATRAAVIRSTILVALTAISGAAALVVFPQKQAIANVWVLLGHLVPFVFGVEAIASLRPEWFRRLRLQMLAQVGCFVMVFCYFVPRMFDRSLSGDSDGFYYLMLTVVPLLILSFALQGRLAGGGVATVRRAAYGSILIMLSGIEDALFWVWRGDPIPQVWDWAYHINVFLGHIASRTEAFVFIAVHLVLALLIFTLPDSFWSGLVARVRTRRDKTPAESGTPA